MHIHAWAVIIIHIHSRPLWSVWQFSSYTNFISRTIMLLLVKYTYIIILVVSFRNINVTFNRQMFLFDCCLGFVLSWGSLFLIRCINVIFMLSQLPFWLLCYQEIFSKENNHHSEESKGKQREDSVPSSHHVGSMETGRRSTWG